MNRKFIMPFEILMKNVPHLIYRKNKRTNFADLRKYTFSFFTSAIVSKSVSQISQFKLYV